MKKYNLDENLIASTLVSISDKAKVDADFINRMHSLIDKELGNKVSYTLFQKIKIKMQNTKFKLAVLLPAITMSIIGVTALANPAAAKEIFSKVKTCGVDLDCYERWGKATNSKYGYEITTYEKQDEQGTAKGLVSSKLSVEQQENILKGMGAQFVQKTKEGLEYRLKSGTKAVIKDPENEQSSAYIEFTGPFHNYTTLYSLEVFGKENYEYDKAYFDALEKIKSETELIDIDKDKSPDALTKYFTGIAKIKGQNRDYKEKNEHIYIYEFNGREFKYVYNLDDPSRMSPVKIYDSKTGEFIHETLIDSSVATTE